MRTISNAITKIGSFFSRIATFSAFIWKSICKILSYIKRKWNWAVISNLTLLIQIISLPSILLSTSLSYYQLREYLAEPDLQIEFTNPGAISLWLFNKGEKLAEHPIYWFGLVNLTMKEQVSIAPIPAKEIPYLKPSERKGPITEFHSYLKRGHRYFGMAGITCRNSDKIQHYFLHFNYPDSINAWYIPVEKKDYPMEVYPYQLLNNTESYLNEKYPLHRRIYIK